MNKVDTLFKKYYRILNEQEVDPMDPTAVSTEPEPEVQAPSEPTVKPISSNEKFVIKILTNAFLFNPEKFSGSKREYINTEINSIKNTVNIPVPELLERIIKLIGLMSGLKITESKTLNAINKYIFLIEQPADATEPQTVDIQPKNATVKVDVNEPSINNLNLIEIFDSLYKELIVKALGHVPTEEESMILKPAVSEFADVDPEKIVTVIKDLLSQSSNKDLEDVLGDNGEESLF